MILIIVFRWAINQLTNGGTILFDIDNIMVIMAMVMIIMNMIKNHCSYNDDLYMYYVYIYTYILCG